MCGALSRDGNSLLEEVLLNLPLREMDKVL